MEGNAKHVAVLDQYRRIVAQEEIARMQSDALLNEQG